MSYKAAEVRRLKEERDYYKSLVGAFMEGRIPEDVVPSLQHHLLAQWGRKRLEYNKATAALLRPPEA